MMRPAPSFIWLFFSVLLAAASFGAASSRAQFALPDPEATDPDLPQGTPGGESEPSAKPWLDQIPLPPEITGPSGPPQSDAGPAGPGDLDPRDLDPRTLDPRTFDPRSAQPKSAEPDISPKDAPDGMAGDKSPNAPDGGDGAKAEGAKPPQDREAVLAELYGHLAQAKDAQEAEPIAKAIEGLWVHNDSPTISLLMARASKAVNDERPDLALKLLDVVVELSPDFAEGWNRRAYVYFMQNNTQNAAGDLRRALALDPKNYKALEGLARILRDSGQKKSALGAYEQLLRIYPFSPGAETAAKELKVELEGQGI